MIPIGLASIAAYVRNAGHSVEVVDAWAESLKDPGQLERRLKEVETPLIIGISIFTTNLAGAKNASLAAKKIFPDSLQIIGGPHVSAVPDEVLNDFTDADIAVYGEGEITMLEIIEKVKTAGGFQGNIPGTIHRKEKTIIKEKPQVPIKDMNKLPRPARDLFNIELYSPHPPYGRKWRYMNEITSRGCPFKCAYCSKSVFGNSYRSFTPERIVDDIRELVNVYGVKEIHFYDDDFTMKRSHSKELMQLLINADFKITWSCTTRCDLVNPELLQLMKKAGCWMISYGVESGNDKLRDTIQKNISREQIKQAFINTKKAGIKVTGYFMIGLPGETEETFRETLDLINELDPHYANWSIMSVYPGSPFYKDILDGKYGKGKLITKNDGGCSPFQDSYITGFEGKLSNERMEQLLKQATRKFYLKPKNIIRLLSDIRSFRQFKKTIRMGLNTLKWIFNKNN